MLVTASLKLVWSGHSHCGYCCTATHACLASCVDPLPHDVDLTSVILCLVIMQ